MSNVATQFKVGNPGGPGRPTGSRNKLSDDFIRELSKDFAEHGVEAIQAVRGDQPAAYLNVIGKLMPKLMELSGPDGKAIDMNWNVEVMEITRADDTDTE